MGCRKSRVVTYTFGEHDFGEGGEALAIKPPVGYTYGELIDVGVAVTETFTADTTSAFVKVGTATDDDAYALLTLGTAADTNYFNTLDDTDALIKTGIPSITQLEVAFVAPTGGTPAGKGYVNIVIEWCS